MRTLLKAIYKHITLCFLIGGALLSLTITFAFPVYFRSDDTIYLHWCDEHPKLLPSLLPSEALVNTTFRPVLNLIWWVLFHTFRLNPVPYQLFTTFLYTLSFLVFYKLVELIFCKRIAIIALFTYLAIFHYLLYISFWFTDLCYIMEILFMSLAIFFFIKAVNNRCSWGPGIIFYFLAVLAKEPSSLIVPIIVLAFIYTRYKHLTQRRRNHSLFLMGLLLGLAVIYLNFGPSQYFQSARGLSFSGGILNMAKFISTRWHYYATHLISGLGIIIWVTTLLLAFKSLLPRWLRSKQLGYFLALIFSVLLSIFLRSHPSLALVILFAAFIPIILKREKVTIGIAWFAIPALGMMSISYIIRTYLVEASFGITILAAAVVDNLFLEVSRATKNLSPKAYRVAAPIIMGLLFTIALVVLIGPLQKHYRALRTVSCTRQNFKNAIDFMDRNWTNDSYHLFVLKYEDMGIDGNDDKAALALTNIQRALEQKTMKLANFRSFLKLMGKNWRIDSLGFFYQNPELREGYLMVMNKSENKFLNQLDLKREPLFESLCGGEIAALYHIEKK